MEQLYLLEVLVHRITFAPKIAKVPEKKDIVTSVIFGNIAQLDIQSDSLTGYAEQLDLLDPRRRTLKINSGKSHLFPSKPDNLLNSLKLSPIRIQVKDLSESQTMGEAVIPWQYQFFDMVEKSKSSKTPPPAYSTFMLDFSTAMENEVAGNITLEIRLSCHGQNIETPYQVIDREAAEGVLPPQRFLFKNPNTDTLLQAQKLESEEFTSPVITVGPLYNPSDPIWKSQTISPTDLTAKRINTMLCKNKDCPGVQKFKEFGLGPAATGKGLGTLYNSVDIPISYGLSHTYGNLHNYGPYGIYTRPKSLDEPFIPKEPLECPTNCNPCPSVPEVPQSNDCCSSNPLRLNGGSPNEEEDDKTPRPMMMCKDLMQSYDRVLDEYKKVLNPCGKVGCPAVSTDYSKDLDTVTPKDQGLVSACGTVDCPYSRPATTPTDKCFQETQMKSACGSPFCKYAKRKLGNATSQDMLEMQLMDGPAIAKPCGSPKCPFPVSPLPTPLEPIHWDCPDPLPKGLCKNPQCPLKPKELRYNPVPKGPCGNVNCPYATPPSCGYSNCPFEPPQSCPYDQPPEQSYAENGCGGCRSNPKSSNNQQGCCSSSKPLPSSCGGPSCPYKQPVSDTCGGPSCPFRCPPPPSGPCGSPSCPFAQNSPCPSGIPDCPYRQPVPCRPPPPPGPCGNPSCPFSQNSSCPSGIPNCPYSQPVPCRPPPPPGPCGNPSCPFSQNNPCPSGIPNCPYSQPVPCRPPPPPGPCGNPSCPFSQNSASANPCGVPDCPYANLAQSEDVVCSNPKCPYINKKASPCYIPKTNNNVCKNPECPYMEQKPSPCYIPPKNSVCSNPNCPYVFPTCKLNIGGTKVTVEYGVDNPPCNDQDKLQYVRNTGDDTVISTSGDRNFNELEPCSPETCKAHGKGSLVCGDCSGGKSSTCPCGGTISVGGSKAPSRDSDPNELEPCSPETCKAYGKGSFICGDCLGVKSITCPCGGTISVRGASETPLSTRDEPVVITSGDRDPNELEPCSQNTCKAYGKGNLICADCTGQSQSSPAIGQQPPGQLQQTSVSEKAIPYNKLKKKARIGNCRKPEGSKFLYKLGDLYPGIHIGHKQCIIPGRNVPAKMGWLWNVHVPCVGLKPRLGWRPGAVGRTVAKKIIAHRKMKGLKLLESLTPKASKKKFKSKYSEYGGDSDSDATIAPKPTLLVKKREGCYYITMNPLKDPKTIEDNENPYMDCTPLQFKISKKKEDEDKTCFCDEEEDDSSNSELDIEFTPPTGVIKPGKLKKKKNVAHTDTQYLVEDFVQKEKPAKGKKNKKGKKGDKNKKKGGKKGGKGKGKGKKK